MRRFRDSQTSQYIDVKHVNQLIEPGPWASLDLYTFKYHNNDKTKDVIIKQISKNPKVLENTLDHPQREKAGLILVQTLFKYERFCPTIHLLGCWETDDYQYLMLETGKYDLLEFINASYETWDNVIKSKYCWLAARILFLLHSKGIYHCDFSTDNLLIVSRNHEDDDNVFVTCDLAQYYAGENQDVNVHDQKHEYDHQYIGKVNFRLPEIDEKQTYSLPRHDMFCLAVVMYTIVVGEAPYDFTDSKTAKKDRLNFQKGIYKHSNMLHKDFKDLLQQLTLHKKSICVDKHIMTHPWLRLWMMQD